jgi:EspG family
MTLTTTPSGIWVLQALLGVETMPVALRLKPFIPSAHSSMMVDTTDGPRPVTQTAEYASLLAAGVIGANGTVDPMVRDWMTVLGRPERQAVLAIRRPAASPDPVEAQGNWQVEERALVVCRRQRWMAMAARCGDEVVVAPVGETDRAEEQVSLTCQTLLAAFGEAEPAVIEGVNLPTELLQSALKHTYQQGRDAMGAALARLGLMPDQIDVIAAAARMDESAMAVVAVIDHGVKQYVHPRVLTVVDTEFGRISVTYTTGADRRRWMSIWPTSAPALQDDLTELLTAARGAA